MRILMLTDHYPPIIGGLERHVQDLSRGLVTRGHEVSVATLWHEGMAEFEIDEGVWVYRIQGTIQRRARLFSDTGRRYAPPIPDPEVLWTLRRLVARERPDIVHAHSWMARSFLPLKAWSNAKLVVSLHDYNLRCAKRSFMYHDSPCDGPRFTKCLNCAAAHYGLAKGVPTVLANWVMGAAERTRVDMFLAVSQAVAIGNGLAGSKLPFHVIPNFVPDDVNVPGGEPDPCLTQLPAEDYLLFVGALSRHKGIDVLLEACAELGNAPPLVLIGSVRPDTPTKFPANVIVLKNWQHDAVMEAWRRSVVGLAPSVCADGCPTAVMEAMATGRPVVASRVGGLPDLVVDGETGFLVPPGDPVALKQAIERLLADPELRERMGQAAMRRVTEFQARTIVPRIEQVYRQLVEGRHQGKS